MSDIQIPIDTVEENFNTYLKIEGNLRILFSGKFGIGKTYFLKEFFSSRRENYDVFHLYPANYQVNCNEDIIQLLKYDILVDLVEKNKDIFSNRSVEGIKETALLFSSWLRERYSLNDILHGTLSAGESVANLSGNPFISAMGKLGRPLKELLEIDKDFQQFKKEYMKGQKGIVEKYLKEYGSKNVTETDYISQLIKEKIVQQKGNRKSVLVLDDLDRIDPEHIFRLLNVLSAYFEREHENKFGFDIIVLVADYSNLRRIFQHKYGLTTDFTGYIDKFFSIAPYYFDNKKAIIDTVEKIVYSIRNEEPRLNNAMQESGYIKLFLTHIFTKAVDGEFINLRQLLKAATYQLAELQKGGFYEDHFSDNFAKLFDIGIKVAIQCFSNIDEFVGVLGKLKNGPSNIEARMPFGVYIEAMLRSLGVKIPEDNSMVKWENYKVTKGDNEWNKLKVVDGNEESLFYDLLISYVMGKRYLIGNYRKY